MVVTNFVQKKIFDILTIPEGEDVYTNSVDALTAHFAPTSSVDQFIYTFRKETQKHDENVASLHTRLQLLAKRCNFAASKDDEVRRQIIQGCSSTRLRRRALEKEKLDEFLKTARAMELANDQVQEYDTIWQIIDVLEII